ncbi:MAG: hypothetical protein ACRDSS_12505, partial [Actinocrinis sp.]
MSKDGVVPPLGGPSRRPAGGPANLSGADKPAGGPGAHRRPEPARDDGWDGGFATAGDLKWSASEAPDAASASAAASIAAQNLAAALRLTAASGASGGVEDLEPERGPLSPAEANLANALRSSVARVGASGPPADSLPRIQRRARTRQRNRTALAGSAGVLVLAIAVTMATGDRFDIVPTLTSAVGLGGSSSGGAPQADGSSEPSVATNGVHTVWPTGSAGKEGLAIGPVAPVMATPSAAAATKVPLCTTSSLNISTTIGTTEGGVVYGSVDAVAQEPCVVVGPPVLTVANQAGTAAQSVKILREDR